MRTMDTKLLFADVPSSRDSLLEAYLDVRRATERLCEPLEPDDYMLQAMPDVSPTKWHLGHVSWFFETFVLRRYLNGYRPVDDAYQFIFNSYYNAVGPQYYRPARGLLSRPTVAQVYSYRARVDKAMQELLERARPDELAEVGSLIWIGMHHEQQHQELIVTDIKYNLWTNPLRPAYGAVEPRSISPSELRWIEFDGGVYTVGHAGDSFAFDNECPAHQVYLRPFRLASRLVTNGEFREFVEAGGYQDWRFWLADGWNLVQKAGWQAPLYWERRGEQWWVYTMNGMAPLRDEDFVCHLSYYEADAYARWAGARLPTEQEWEVAARLWHQAMVDARTCDAARPERTARGAGALEQMVGLVWQWTRSPYVPYPGFRPWPDGLGEYNGKFMVNQMVLRGASWATPPSHVRLTYRNFFPPDARWQFSGLRLAQDA